jgi:hypothetical protein
MYRKHAYSNYCDAVELHGVDRRQYSKYDEYMCWRMRNRSAKDYPTHDAITHRGPVFYVKIGHILFKVNGIQDAMSMEVHDPTNQAFWKIMCDYYVY